MPAGTGKKIKVAVVCEDTKSNEAKEAGAEIVGGDNFIDEIKDGTLNFDKLFRLMFSRSVPLTFFDILGDELNFSNC